MNITDIRIRSVNTEGKLKAIVSITLDDAIVIHDIKIIDGHQGLFIAMPSRKVGEGDFRDIAHPIHSEARAYLQEEIFKAYEACQEDQESEQVECEDEETEDVTPMDFLAEEGEAAEA